MSFLERECGISLAAALAFLDETLDTTDVPQLSHQTLASSAAVLSSPRSAIPDPELLLEALDEDDDSLVPLSQTALTPTTPAQLQLESSSSPVQHTTIVPASSSKTQPKTSRSKKKKLNYDPNKARNERRFELACLRKEVKDLELTLEQLQSMQGSDKSSTSVKRPRQLVPRASGGSGMSAVWEQICAHQLERRLRVERENIHLKMMYKSQVQVAKSIEKLLQKRLALQDTTYSEISKHTSRIEVPQGYDTDVDQRIFEELSTGVDVSYREVESVFDEHAPGRTEFPTTEPLLRDSVNGKYMELFDNKIMPFDMRSTGDAWWRRWHNYKGHCAHENGPNNTIVEKFGLEMKDVKTRTTATFYVQQFLRRHVEEGRIVIVWHAHIKPLEFEKKAANGVHYLEKGYVLIKPHITDSPMDEDEAATRVMTCYIITPHLSNRKLRTDARTTALTDFVLSATSANISMSNEMIENLLVDRAMKRGKANERR
ncbi:hypothetical protein PF005_g1788 [Phytophthora fragariae]|uniref:M96 mating-specific protein family n=1 Tax=Phytophthora fragariae TaxID=53985 RepID=A0A6A3FW19_9STRA|nr:hypothetical protein PF003_g15499 [Phytophthora fragariae]KAE8948616.1 hypothetical protein PF009_g1833 [Phytophthora fragariae]KAE9029010.1 hypothetical protein PF011_g1275 [Phytophthora fragariae]KAE9137063.1 hypothetical protein PF010_g1467 [Phytophthora fragariae]KAE9137189.1 hypothetical protein PF007_g1898 [Phytophthora fragariae]